MCSKREYVCHRQIPKANSQVCAISSALTDGEPSRQSRLAAFRQLWTSRSICCRTHFQNAAIELLTHHKKKKRSKQCCHEHYHALMLVVTHSPHPLIELCVFPNSVSHRRRRRAGNVKKSLRPATNVPLTETNTPSSSRIPYTDCYICKWCFWKGRWTDLELLLELAVETCQHRVGFLVFTDRHLDLPLLFGQQPEGEFYPHLSGFQFISALVQSTT